MQLLPKNKNEPPVVFHIFPIIGSTVSYGIDPYKFLFDNREKVGRTVRVSAYKSKLICRRDITAWRRVYLVSSYVDRL